MLESERSDSGSGQAIRCPGSVKLIAWLTILNYGVGLICALYGAGYFAVNHSFPKYAFQVTYQNKPLHPTLVITWLTIAVALLFVTFVLLSAFYTLRGRMWAYYVILGSLVLDLARIISRDLSGQPELVLPGDLSTTVFLLLWICVYKAYRQFANSQVARPTPES